MVEQVVTQETPVVDGQTFENFSLAVAEYLTLKEEITKAEAKAETERSTIIAYLQANGLDEETVGDRVVKLLHQTRESVDQKVAKVVIPKKYLAQILKVTHFDQLRITKVKE